jgi:hypothetical protein
MTAGGIPAVRMRKSIFSKGCVQRYGAMKSTGIGKAMKISILGSWDETKRDWPTRGTFDEFKSACFEIGREFGKFRQPIVVAGDSESTADVHIVRGMLEQLKGQHDLRPLIEVMRSKKNPKAYEELAKANPDLFSFHVQPEAKWAQLNLILLREADVVLTIGGTEGTYESGLAAIAARKKLVPVANFGGASAKLSAALEGIVAPGQRDDIRSLNGTWTSRSVGQVVKLAGVGAPPKVLIIHGHSADWKNLSEWLKTAGGIKDVIVMKDEFMPGKTLPEKFEELASRVDKAIAVATPDDLGERADRDHSEFRQRARQNIWLEIGWFWGRLGRDSVMVLNRGAIEYPSDLTGLEFYDYDEDPREQSEKMRAFLGLQHRKAL